MRKTLLFILLLAASPASLLGREVSLQGSHDSLVRQRKMAEKHHAPAIVDDEHFKQLRDSGALVPIIETPSLQVNPRELAKKWRWLRPSAMEALNRVSVEFRAKFKIPLTVNSATRTIPRQVQISVKEKNPNATSVALAAHTRGTTFDLAFYYFRGEGKNRRRVAYTPAQHRWLRHRFLELEAQDDCMEVTLEKKARSTYHGTVSDGCVWPGSGPPVPAPPQPVLPGALYAHYLPTSLMNGSPCLAP